MVAALRGVDYVVIFGDDTVGDLLLAAAARRALQGHRLHRRNRARAGDRPGVWRPHGDCRRPQGPLDARPAGATGRRGGGSVGATAVKVLIVRLERDGRHRAHRARGRGASPGEAGGAHRLARGPAAPRRAGPVSRGRRGHRRSIRRAVAETVAVVRASSRDGVRRRDRRAGPAQVRGPGAAGRRPSHHRVRARGAARAGGRALLLGDRRSHGWPARRAAEPAVAARAGHRRLADRDAGPRRANPRSPPMCSGQSGCAIGVLNPGAGWPNKQWPPEKFGARRGGGAEVARPALGGRLGSRGGTAGPPRGGGVVGGGDAGAADQPVRPDGAGAARRDRRGGRHRAGTPGGGGRHAGGRALRTDQPGAQRSVVAGGRVRLEVRGLPVSPQAALHGGGVVS